MRLPLALYGVALSVCLVPFLAAQDAAKVDAKHYTVISENDQGKDFESALRPPREVGHAPPSRHGCRVSNRRQRDVQLSGREEERLYG